MNLSFSVILLVVATILFVVSVFVSDRRLVPAGLACLAGAHLTF